MNLDRWAVERAIKASALAPPSRLILFTLLTHVSNGTLVIPARYSPSLTALTKETGLGRSTVTDHLNLLERDGWLDRSRPSTKEALTERARTAYRIQVPASVLAEMEAELVREPDQSESRTSPGAGLVEPAEQEDLFSASPGAGPVREPDGTSPGAGLISNVCPMSSPTEKTEGGAGGTRKPAQPSGEEHPRFAEWYAAYPLRDKRPQAVKAFNKAIRKVGDAQLLIDAAKRYAEHDPRVKRGFIKGPSVWLNNDCWDDEIPPDPDLRPVGADGRTSNGSGSQVPPRGPRQNPFRNKRNAS